jgi:diacylglycerol kinase family enzyme
MNAIRPSSSRSSSLYQRSRAFVLALKSVVRRYLRLRIKVHMDQAEALEHVTPFLFVGNNRYQTSGLKIGTRSRLDSGQLWVCTAPRSDRQNFVRTALRTLLGHKTDQDLNAFEVKVSACSWTKVQREGC